MTWHSIESPDAVIEAPKEIVGEESFSLVNGCVEVATPGHGNERYVVKIVICYLIDDGQLPSAYRSPLGPENHVHGLDFLAQNECSGRLERKREVWGTGTLRLGGGHSC